VPDFKITGTFTTKRIKDERYKGYDILWAESQLNLKLVNVKNDREIFTYQLPDEKYTDTRGVGKTINEAYLNSLKLSNMTMKQQMLESLAKEIDRTILASFNNRISK